MEQQDVVVLVDEHGHDLFHPDGRLSTIEKIDAHRRGLLHRAVSVFIFNDRNEFLLQRRAMDKYHSPGKWSNTCCTHPQPGETPLMAALRRLRQEMGLIARLTEAFTFRYQADFGNGLRENEFDHILLGVSNQAPNPNPVEVCDWRWVPTEELKRELVRNPEGYTPWLRQCFERVIEYKLQHQNRL